MRWETTAALYRWLDRLPFGSRVHYAAQRRLLGTFPISDERMQRERFYAERHMRSLEGQGWSRGRPAEALEFGAGRHLAVALELARSGVHVVATDITPLVREDLVRDAATRLGCPLDDIDLDRALRSRGIDYRVMPPSRLAGIADASMDIVYSTSVLEHVPAEEIGPLLAECRRVLRPNGRLSLVVDYKDHYGYGPGEGSRWNFLTIDRDRWFRRYSPAIHYQNRLRHSDVVQAVVDAGFRVTVANSVAANADDLRWASEADLAPEFRHYEHDDLCLSEADIVGIPN